MSGTQCQTLAGWPQFPSMFPAFLWLARAASSFGGLRARTQKDGSRSCKSLEDGAGICSVIFTTFCLSKQVKRPSDSRGGENRLHPLTGEVEKPYCKGVWQGLLQLPQGPLKLGTDPARFLHMTDLYKNQKTKKSLKIIARKQHSKKILRT